MDEFNKESEYHGIVLGEINMKKQSLSQLLIQLDKSGIYDDVTTLMLADVIKIKKEIMELYVNLINNEKDILIYLKVRNPSFNISKMNEILTDHFMILRDYQQKNFCYFFGFGSGMQGGR